MEGNGCNDNGHRHFAHGADGIRLPVRQGTGWAVRTSGQTVTATYTGVIAAYSSFPSLVFIVSVDPTAAASLVNTVTVAGGGELTTANNTASDTTTVAQVAALAINYVDDSNLESVSPFRQGSTTAQIYVSVINNSTADITYSCYRS